MQKEVGAWNYLQIMEGLEAFTYGLFTRTLGYSQQEVDVVCAEIRKEMKNPKMHAYFYLWGYPSLFKNRNWLPSQVRRLWQEARGQVNEGRKPVHARQGG